MKRNNLILATSLLLLGFLPTGCTAWLTEPQPDVTTLNDFYTSAEAATQNVTACYVPLQWEYGDTYCAEWFIGDIMSDDALKGGGSLNDMADAYDMELWKTVSDNVLIHDYWRAQSLGISRCNQALTYISGMPIDTALTASLKNRLLGEVHFLRAYYYFRMVRAFGGVPLVDHVITDDTEWSIPRSSAKDIYAFLLSDLNLAQQYLWRKSEYATEDLGRATQGAAEAMLCKVHLYLASDGNAANRTLSQQEHYKLASQWADSVIMSGEYSLCPQYADNFTLDGENGPESIFEIQYVGDEDDNSGDYGDGFGFTRGTFTTVLTRSRSTIINTLGDGWGFNHPSENLFQEFEEGDIRREVTIYRPTANELTSPNEETFLGNSLISRKYGIYNTVYTPEDAQSCVTIYKLGHATRGPLNNQQIRYADLLLMKAEALLGLGDAGNALSYIDEVRARVGLPGAPQATWETLRHERRCELAMEGHRWFDLCRWGIAYETMTEYEKTETDLYTAQLDAGFQKGKHELLPIPLKEIELNPAMTQNPGY